MKRFLSIFVVACVALCVPFVFSGCGNKNLKDLKTANVYSIWIALSSVYYSFALIKLGEPGIITKTEYDEIIQNTVYLSEGNRYTRQDLKK